MAASLGKPPSEINPEDELRLAVRQRARAGQDTTIGEDDPPRGLVVVVAGDFEPPQAGPARHRQDQGQRAGRVTEPPLPRHDRIADMARYIIGKVVAT